MDPWYREELQPLLDLVKSEIKRLGRNANASEQAALGHLYGKLTREIEIAPSMASS